MTFWLPIFSSFTSPYKPGFDCQQLDYWFIYIIIGQLHDDVILPQLPKSFSFLFSSTSKAIAVFFLNLSRIDKFKQESKKKCLLVIVVKFRYRKNDLLTSHFQLLHKPLRTWVWLSTTRLVFQRAGSYPAGYPEMDLLRDLHCTTRKKAPLVKRTLSLFTMELFSLRRSREWRNTQNTIFKCLHSPTLGKDRKALLWRKEQVKTVRHVQSKCKNGNTSMYDAPA